MLHELSSWKTVKTLGDRVLRSALNQEVFGAVIRFLANGVALSKEALVGFSGDPGGGPGQTFWRAWLIFLAIEKIISVFFLLDLQFFSLDLPFFLFTRLLVFKCTLCD